MAGTSTTEFILAQAGNALGTVVALSQYNTTDGYASIVEQYKYSAFGETTVTLDGSTGNPYRFTARRWDDESGLYYYRARMYSPYIGRFLQTDPLGYFDSMNMYSYCGNNPVNWIDPWGLCTKDENPKIGDTKTLIEDYVVLPWTLDPSELKDLEWFKKHGMPTPPSPDLGFPAQVAVGEAYSNAVKNAAENIHALHRRDPKSGAWVQLQD